MNVLMSDIFEFYELRISCHVKSMNYFADILGYHFPEHDGDKVEEPIRTGYAYVFYNAYHKNFHLSNEHIALCKDAGRLHHEHANHHIQHYSDASQIPDIYLYEMIADWASANFEQMNIIKEKDAVSIEEWFANNMAQYNWTNHQLEIIKNAFEKIAKNTNNETVVAIWQPVVEKSDL